MTFYFDVFQSGELRADPDGGHFPDLEAATADAEAAAREILVEAVRCGAAPTQATMRCGFVTPPARPFWRSPFQCG
jgi:hypothetical protein